MFSDFQMIKMLYGWGALVPSAEYYVQNNKLTADQYKELTGKKYAATA
ncbi:hypothetical protein MUDAN_DOGOELCO_02111 [Lactiplantibacillus mudanjiangensis]|nr:XkdX family protein [Lactiplantibacillus mudanjiangensis]VDG32897.1 hypothetical protein MUDAN_DOGOELCO_02111 [Lactiplantibacillus mudanjiangensis]